MIALSSEHSANLDEYSTMPSSKFYALALIKLLKKFNWDYVTAILSQQDSASLAVYGQFERLASERGICISDEIHVDGEHSPEAITSSTTNVTLLFTTAADAANFFAAKLRRESSSAHVYVVIGDAHDFYLHDPSNVAKLVGTVSLQPKDVSYDDFREWLEITTPLTLPEQWYWRFVENRWQCALLQSSRKTYNDKLCTGDELLDVPMLGVKTSSRNQKNLGRMTRSGYLSRGVERFLFAMDVVYRRLCPEQTGVCSDFYRNGRSFSYRTIGNWSLDDGLRFTDAYKNFDINGNQIPSQNAAALRTVSRCEPPLCKCWMDKDFFKNPLHMPFNEDVTLLGGSYVQSEPTASNNQLGQQDSPVLKHITEGQWHIHGSNYAFLVIITLLILTALAVLLLICVKVYLRVVKGNQSLGISLLVGIIILYFTGYAFVFDPSDILRNAETIGFSHSIHISFWNYWLLLFFILGVQIALSVRWVTEQFAASIVLDGTSMHTRCTFGVEEFLLSQTYVVLLLILALFINSRNRNIKRNYKETKWLFIAALTCVLLWMAWMITYVAVSPPYKDMVIVVELMLCASVLLIFLFGPKIYILLSYEPVIVEYNAQAGKCKDGVYENGLFEKDDEMKRSVSPTDSYATMTQTSLCNIHKASAATPHSIASTSGACSDEQVRLKLSLFDGYFPLLFLITPSSDQ
ncbi:unnamed protein product [Anisakis simplex]|uniref:G-protein coupled receptors family 3 profile domain-containing protein n=1 Tax=Anisakis simplex TaxID=6269 RepID=A0A3P6RKS9_ANISI|nr:unnamed protein product [Anisakis simplex]